MVSCAVVGCLSHYRKDLRGLTFHHFPSNLELRLKWIKAVNRPNWEPDKKTVLCSRHFRDDQFDAFSYRTFLTKGAVPCIFNDYPEDFSDKQAPSINLNPDCIECIVKEENDTSDEIEIDFEEDQIDILYQEDTIPNDYSILDPGYIECIVKDEPEDITSQILSNLTINDCMELPVDKIEISPFENKFSEESSFSSDSGFMLTIDSQFIESVKNESLSNDHYALNCYQQNVKTVYDSVGEPNVTNDNYTNHHNYTLNCYEENVETVDNSVGEPRVLNEITIDNKYFDFIEDTGSENHQDKDYDKLMSDYKKLQNEFEGLQKMHKRADDDMVAIVEFMSIKDVTNTNFMCPKCNFFCTSTRYLRDHILEHIKINRGS